MKVSILTPSYNQAAFLDQNILSILSQDIGESVEHIVMDGGSSDGSVDVLRKYPHLIWRSEPDRGQAHALNKALAIVSGDIIGWVNSDDMLAPDSLATVVKYFEKNPEQHVLVGNILVIDESGNCLYRISAESVTFEGLLNGGQNVLQVSTFFRRTVFEKAGHFNESLHYCMDHEFFLRVSKLFNFHKIDVDFGMFRRYPETKTSSNPLGFIREKYMLRKTYSGRLFCRTSYVMLYMFITEPFRRIGWLRREIRKIKGANPDFIRYA